MTLDEELAMMADNRKRQREDYIYSKKFEIDNEILNFKVWCHTKGWWNNLGEKDFKMYKTTTGKQFDFEMEKAIYERCFGYTFTYDDLNGKWHSKCEKHLMLNPKGQA